MSDDRSTAPVDPESRDRARLRARPISGPRPRPLAAETEFGRYRIKAHVATGGMGEVYRAQDPQLQRDVALKMLRTDIGFLGDHGADRWRAEARALAKLRHRSVTAVYDVDVIEDHEGTPRAYIAMEFFEGKSLQRWAEERRPDHHQILRVFTDVAEALAAAHRAGVLHRDVKPDNVLVASTGEVRLTDFGLAGYDSNKKDHLLFGTPGYVAPELFAGGGASAAADQWSFFASLLAVFRGSDPPQILPPPVPSHDFAGRRLPTHIIDLLERGLDSDPGRRFGDMDVVTRRLRHFGERRRRTKIIIGIGGALAVGAAVGLFVREPASPCASARGDFAEAWNDERRAAIQSAFAASDARFAEVAAREVVGVLDAYAARWTMAREKVCQATMVDGEASTDLMHMRDACLDRQRGQVAALANALATGDRNAVATAVSAVRALPSPETCAESGELGEIAPRPADVTIATKVDEVRSELDAATAARLSGRYDGALTRLERVQASAEPLAYAPLLGEIALERGRTAIALRRHALAESSLREALAHAERASFPRLRAEIGLALAHELSVGQKRFAAADEVLAAADAVISSGLDPELELELDMTRARLALVSGDPQTALELYETLVERADTESFRSDILLAMGQSYRETGRYQPALDPLERALKERERRFGPAHPAVAEVELEMARVETRLGKLDAARERLETVQRVYTQTHGGGGLPLADVYLARGIIEVRDWELDEAESWLQRARAVVDADRDRVEADVVEALNALGVVYSRRGDYEQAEAMLQAAIENISRSVGPTHSRMALPLTNLAATAVRSGNYPAALAWLERTMEVEYHRARKLDHRVGMGDVHQVMGQLERAKEIYEEILDNEPESTAGRFAALGLVEIRLRQGERDLGDAALGVLESAERLGASHPRHLRAKLARSRLAPADRAAKLRQEVKASLEGRVSDDAILHAEFFGPRE